MCIYVYICIYIYIFICIYIYTHKYIYIYIYISYIMYHISYIIYIYIYHISCIIYHISYIIYIYIHRIWCGQLISSHLLRRRYVAEVSLGRVTAWALGSSWRSSGLLWKSQTSLDDYDGFCYQELLIPIYIYILSLLMMMMMVMVMVMMTKTKEVHMLECSSTIRGREVLENRLKTFGRQEWLLYK